MKPGNRLLCGLRFFQVDFAIGMSLVGVSFIFNCIVGRPLQHDVVWDDEIVALLWWIIIACVAYIAYLCKAPSAVLTIGGYVSLSIARLAPQYMVASRIYAPLWSGYLAGVGIGLLGMGLWFRLKRDKAIKRGSLPAIEVRTSLRIYGYELWQILEWLLFAIAAVLIILHVIFSIAGIKAVLFS